MNRHDRWASGRALVTSLALVFSLQIDAGAGPWDALQDRCGRETSAAGSAKRLKEQDPWARLRAIFFPFSEETETAALSDPGAAREVSGELHRALRPYASIIHKASHRFDIPPAIIGAVIMAESGGDPMAQARTSSAKGLMQTIDGTFRDAREGLLAQGIVIADDPFNPHASIMAGAWYLDQMYAQAVLDGKGVHLDRQSIASWRHPVEYYYAGPGNGRRNEQRLIVYAGGRRVVIDKPAYSRKVLQWAEIMSKAG